MGENFDKTKKQLAFSKIKFLSYLILILLCITILGTTFTWYFISKGSQNQLKFGQVTFDDATTIVMSSYLSHAIAGDPIVDTQVSFKKLASSRPMYVRAKLSFESDAASASEETMRRYLSTLRQDTVFNIVTTNQNGAVWKPKVENYTYLVSASNSNNMFSVTDTYTYILTTRVSIPLEQLVQGPNLDQYLKKIKFTIAFEAIQSENIETNFVILVNYFDNAFPESAAEKYIIETFE